MAPTKIAPKKYSLKTPARLSSRIKSLRDYYFEGTNRNWNNEFTSWTTETPWDTQFNELSFYIVPENYALLQTFVSSFRQAARPVTLHPDFWNWSLVERRAWFVREVMVRYLPHEILPGDLLAGGRFNVQTSLCLNRREAKQWDRLVTAKGGARARVKWFHDHGYGNAGATSGHLIPGHQQALEIGWKGLYGNLQSRYTRLSKAERAGAAGAQIRAMITSATMARDLADEYSKHLVRMAHAEENPARKVELLAMAANLGRVPWHPPTSFWEAVQALWINHMLIMADENYPGPGISFGRIDQILLPYWRRSIDDGMDPEFGKEILKCFWIHCNTAYDALIRAGHQGITAGFGQLITLSGLGPDGRDQTNELTYAILDVIEDMSPILEPKPNVRLHRNSPEKLLDRLVGMIAESQGAPFLLNFDERSMAGMLRQAARAGLTHLIHAGNVHDYAPVGCLENTMVGNDRSGTVDANLNLVKAVELVLGRGRDLVPYQEVTFGTELPIEEGGPDTGDPLQMDDFEAFYSAYEKQTEAIISRCVDLYERSESIRTRFFSTPYLSCLVKGCAEQAKDINAGGAEISLVTLEAVTFATTVDSLLAIKYLVYETGICTMDKLIVALRNNWEGHEILQARARFKAPKYGRDDEEADALAQRVMRTWTEITWQHRTKVTDRQFRPGMLSWNYWVGDGFVLPATPDGRPRGKFLSNAICPSTGADINGPTANVNSVGTALGGTDPDGGDWKDVVNLVPNGASHTITFSPALIRDPEHLDKFKAFLRSYAVQGGTALQINILDSEMLKEAQRSPADYRHLLVRITGYNAYFTTIGKELQDEVIARLTHEGV
jgi:trans-4-hydroxy-L-proline dehydratase